uniref:ATP synthase F0 subunit 8 n=1 Tax=Epeus alboguttatus TaxID=2575944 RepID=A0A4P8DP86_9ARAC|nr:ATP synthase F0 subunit 8 [Epeus alboguttatus]QCL18086.1 ATP synthase F0 subunit 8 [Epeus alboguttatus]
MPQLMPLMWIMSLMMNLFLMFMLVDMYFYMSDNLMNFSTSLEVNKVMMKW